MFFEKSTFNKIIENRGPCLIEVKNLSNQIIISLKSCQTLAPFRVPWIPRAAGHAQAVGAQRGRMGPSRLAPCKAPSCAASRGWGPSLSPGAI